MPESGSESACTTILLFPSVVKPSPILIVILTLPSSISIPSPPTNMSIGSIQPAKPVESRLVKKKPVPGVPVADPALVI